MALEAVLRSICLVVVAPSGGEGGLRIGRRMLSSAKLLHANSLWRRGSDRTHEMPESKPRCVYKLWISRIRGYYNNAIMTWEYLCGNVLG